MKIVVLILLSIGGYFIGSLSPAVFLSKKYAGYDIREKGSKNAGSTNVFRVMGAKWGMFNFILDALKGTIPTLIGLLVAGQNGALCAGGGIIIGHALPVFSHFKGGKSVASSFGVLMVLNPIMTTIAFLVGVAIIIVSGYVSLASVTVFTLYPIIIWFVPGTLALRIFTSVVGAFVVFLHRENIKRLLKGCENKLTGGKKKTQKQAQGE